MGIQFITIICPCIEELNNHFTLFSLFFKKVLQGQEPWSSGYGRRCSCSEGRGFESHTVYWMDIFYIYLLYKL